MEDQELIARCRAGESAAFEAIVTKYQSSLLTMTWSLMGNKEDARDATQEAFLSAFAKLGAYDPSRSFRTWLFAIAWKKCLDMKRREKTRRAFLQRWKAPEPPLCSASAESVLERAETLNGFFRVLRPKERLALSLRINEGYSAAEIAPVLGCTEGSVRVFLCSAVQKIRKRCARGKVDV